MPPVACHPVWQGYTAGLGWLAVECDGVSLLESPEPLGFAVEGAVKVGMTV